MKRPLKKSLDNYSSMKVKTLLCKAAIISLIISIVAVAQGSKLDVITSLKKVFLSYFPMIYINIAPIMLVFKRGIIRKIEEKPIYAVIFIFYFLFFLPIFEEIYFEETRKMVSEDNIFFYTVIVFFNFFCIIVSHAILIKYVFLDIILKKRKTAGGDILIILFTYITMGVSFGFVYAVITIIGVTPSFEGMDLSMMSEMGGLKLYLRHIYFSFITLTSVGYGDISPLTWPAQLVVVIESVLGVLLLSFSLGIILSSEAEEKDKILEDKDEKLIEKLAREVEKVVDKKLNERENRGF